MRASSALLLLMPSARLLNLPWYVLHPPIPFSQPTPHPHFPYPPSALPKQRIERTPFSLDPGSNGRDPSPGYPLWRANHVMLGVWIPEQEMRAISESLPEPSLRTQFVNVFFARFVSLHYSPDHFSPAA